MHIGLELALEVLNATPTNRMDPVIKDYFLNRTISEFVKNVINKTNHPDESKRVPFRLLTYGDIINKYNSIYTLIKIDDNLLPILSVIDNSFYKYILPSDLFRFETSFSNVRPVNCITYPSASAPTVAITGTPGYVELGLHYYFITFVYPTEETDVSGIGVANVTLTTAGQVNITNIPLGLSGCTARKIYRSKVGEKWYQAKLLVTISNNTTTTYLDDIADASLVTIGYSNLNDTQLPNVLLDLYDIIAFNSNPYGGKGKYIGTIIENGGLQLYHLNRYAISKVGIIYVKKPAILTSSPSIINCDLPESVHDEIVDDTARFIAAAITSGNYQQLLMEAKEKK